MDFSITQVPIWISILFILSFGTLPILLITRSVKLTFTENQLGNSSEINKKIRRFYLFYFIVISLISLTEFFTKNAIPPRIMLTAILPLFLFYFFWVQKTEWFKLIFKHMKIEYLVAIHTFRFVGVFFIIAHHFKAYLKNLHFWEERVISSQQLLPTCIFCPKKEYEIFKNFRLDIQHYWLCGYYFCINYCNNCNKTRNE